MRASSAWRARFCSRSPTAACPQRLYRIKAKTLLIWGDSDRLIAPGLLRRPSRKASRGRRARVDPGSRSHGDVGTDRTGDGGVGEIDMMDLIIRGGTVADGTGGELREADVAVKDGKIAAIGKIADKGTQEIDARGLLVTPGLRRHPHPLRRPGDLGRAAGAVELARRDDGGDGQLRRRLRAGAPGHHGRLIELMEGVEDIPGVALHEGLKWNWDILRRLSRRAGAQAARHRRLRPARARGATASTSWASAARRSNQRTKTTSQDARADQGSDAGRRHRLHHLATPCCTKASRASRRRACAPRKPS